MRDVYRPLAVQAGSGIICVVYLHADTNAHVSKRVAWPPLDWVLSVLPRRMRHWPGVRRYFWQPEDIAAIRRRAHEHAQELDRWTDR